MTEKEPLHNLSRRRVLGGLGAIGLASAGAGLGTSAFFSDTEPFEGNVLTAGELNLRVNYYSWWDQDTAGTDYRSGLVDGPDSTVSGILDDIKPGDEGMLAFCFEVVDNPAYLWTCGSLVANDDNGLTEPEGEVDETGGDEDGKGGGELADAIMVNAFYGDVTVTDGFDPSDVTDGNAIVSGFSLAEFMSLLGTGLPLDGTGTGGLLDPGTQSEFAGSSAEGDNPCLIIEWWVPKDVGNEIQTDSVEFDLLFSAMQARHNDGTANPCVEGITSTTGSGWAKLEEQFNGDGTIAAGARARRGVDGSGDWELAVGLPGESGLFNQGEYLWTDGATVPWTVSYDAGTDTMTLNLDGTTVSKVLSDQPDGRIGVQAKAYDGSTVEVQNISTDLGSISGPTSVTATLDELKYIVLDTSLDGNTSFTLSGDVTLSDIDVCRECAVLDVVFE